MVLRGRRRRGSKLYLLWSLAMVVIGSQLVEYFMGEQLSQHVRNASTSTSGLGHSIERNLLEEASVPLNKHVGFNLVTTVLGIVLFLLTLTIIFETLKDYIEEHTTSNMRLIVDKLFGEMTVLGFLSMFTFAFASTGIFTVLSILIFNDTTTLSVIFDEVHYTIFFIMVFFVLQVLILMYDAMKTETEWLDFEREVKNPVASKRMAQRAREYYENRDTHAMTRNVCREMVSLLPGMRGGNLELHENEILYKALRDEFILERHIDPPFVPIPEANRLDKDFNFGRYLSIGLGQMLAQTVNLHFESWLFFAFCAVAYWGFVLLVNRRVEVLAWTWVVMAWCMYINNLYFERHLIHVRRAFAHKELFHAVRALKSEQGFSDGFWVENETTYLKRMSVSGGDTSLPLWTDADVDIYMEKRSLLARLFSGGGRPNRQQVFYWMDRKGPRFYTFILQINLIFIGVFVAMNALGFVSHMRSYCSLPAFLFYCAMAFLPLLGVVFFKRDMIAAMATVCCLGAYRRPDVVAKVLREELTIQVVRAFIIIYKLRKFALHADQSVDKIDNLEKYTASRADFEEFELNEVGKTFDAFDTSGDGLIDYQEFEALMNNIGADMTPESLQRMVDVLDDDGNGEVSRDEFIDWYVANATTDDSTPEEQADDLFRLFDDDDSGNLTIGEFKQRLDAINIGFTVDDIGAIVNELDSDGNGTIGPEEFASMIQKHYPKELQKTAANGASD